MPLLLDTHLILWWQGMRNKIPQTVHSQINAADGIVYVSRASLWEIAIKVNQGKIQIDLPKFCRRIAADGFVWLPIENAHLLQLSHLPLFSDHKDPFDRLLVAQSISDSLTLLTVDTKLARYGPTVQIV
ncbi:MAG: type II toxin-antitoxin system VapC family toxin [Gammaproteobacteria bacterium]|nr:type II toxin-antitoxin system VapC family toxin [Gammaproteobacteria bacterium]NNJ84559.1 type II toxin-antitoxin system VapC family toxin [Gammaproteobacteria bacterium]